MTHPSFARSLQGLSRGFKRLRLSDPSNHCRAPNLTRAFASETTIPYEEIAKESEAELPPAHDPFDAQAFIEQTTSDQPSPVDLSSRILTTLYSWPALEPRRFAWYNAAFLDVPLRRDLLHRAVIFEADASRQGTASTKWRDDVHGGGRKLHAQKGTGKARVGDKKSPTRKGGGVAFGPHPRDFSTGLQRKVYDMAWRTALSHRYRKGELIILDESISIPQSTGSRLLANIFQGNGWGRADGRSLLVTALRQGRLSESMKEIGEHGAVKDLEDVDVKDLLETGRIVIEKAALDTLFATHSSDLGVKMSLQHARTADKSNIVQYMDPMASEAST